MNAALAVARRGLLGGESCCGAALVRGIQTSLQRLQGLAENPDSQATEAPEAQKKKDFSFFPPVPGRGSTLRWAGKKYEEIPIAHIKATYNNTHVHVVSHLNVPVTLVTCGTEGFKNAKKSTGIAAQTAGISAAAVSVACLTRQPENGIILSKKKARAKGVSHVRVVVKGLGPGRQAAIIGLTMGGLEVISITDNTPIPHNGCRPRKARRL